MYTLRNKIAQLIGINNNNDYDGNFSILETTIEKGYTRQLIEYGYVNNKVTAFLLLPNNLN